jgi:dephospho-CoA kinase
VLICVHSQPRERFLRLVRRGRSDDIRDVASFVERERSEGEVGLKSLFEDADYYFINEGVSEEEAVGRAMNLLKMILGMAGDEG